MMTMRFLISGRVQGVGYRGWAIRQAAQRGLDGWVRTRTDGTVDALVSGPEDVVRDFLFLCHKGPLAASVTHIEAVASDETVEPGFHQAPTL